MRSSPSRSLVNVLSSFSGDMDALPNSIIPKVTLQNHYPLLGAVYFTSKEIVLIHSPKFRIFVPMNTVDTMPHQGRNIKRIREILGVKQDALAIDLGLSQQAVSLLEQKETLDAPMLEKVATILGVPEEAIKNFNEDIAINIISSTLHDNAGSINNNCTFSFNPIDKIVELYNEKMELYERMLQSEKEKVALLNKLLDK